jgi:cytochrome oxidase Cu insertion factor (SCO1/SenC/PrrC family)
MRITAFVVILFLMCAASSIIEPDAAGARSGQKRRQQPARYACPMDREVTSTGAGKCPKCGMVLRLVGESNEADRAGSGDTEEGGAENRASISSSRIPDVRVYDENGKELRFYSDLVKGKSVAINFIFTTCTTICPPLTATFRRVQEELKERAPDIRLISISVDPTIDTPERLHEFALKFKAGPGWTFVTGDKAEIDLLLRALGAAVADKNDHTPMILLGNDPTDYWTRSYGLSSPEVLVRVIAEVASRK